MPCGDGGFGGGGGGGYYYPESLDDLIKLIRKTWDRVVEEETTRRLELEQIQQRNIKLQSLATFDGVKAVWTGPGGDFTDSPTGQWLNGLGNIPVEVTVIPEKIKKKK